MYLIHKDELLTTTLIGRIINAFRTNELPRLVKYKNYYDGNQAILQREATDVGKPNQKIVVNYCSSIVDNYQGYLVGIPIQYSNNTVDISGIIDILNYNDVEDEDSEYLREALIYGRAFEVTYIDTDKKQRIKLFSPEECIPVYYADMDNELAYVIRFYANKVYTESSVGDDEYFVEVYSPTDITVYKSTNGFGSFEFVSQVPHYYRQVPITVFSLNRDQTSIFSQIISMQDAYNTIISDSINDFESFSDAYLILYGMDCDENDLTDMKSKRVLLMDSDAKAEYLTKNFSDAQTQNLLTELNKKIHTIAASPDLNDESFYSQSGIAIRYKLVGMETRSSGIEQQMRKAITKRIELLSAIMSLTDSESEEVWSDIELHFSRNLPNDLTENVNTVVNLQNRVSEKTLLGLLPFVSDPEAEIEAVRKQKEENMDLFDFNVSSNIENTNIEEEENQDEVQIDEQQELLE